LEFGVSIDPAADDLAASLRLARAADAAGLDHLAVQDHPYQPTHLDSWTLQTYLAASTDRISVLGDVLDLGLRPPTLLAKAAASLSVATGGRVTLGVGGGATADGIAAMGGVPRRGTAMVEHTEEAVRLLRRALRGGVVRSNAAGHAIGGYQAGPVPPRPVEVWVGAQGPRMLAAVGRSADGWISPLNIYVRPDEVPEKQRIVDDAARAAGRDPHAVRRVYNVIGAIGPYRGGPGLVGPVEKWADTLASWSTDLGFDTFVFWPATDADGQLETFANEVVPAVRARVGEEVHA
jgi:alkanesulfonate monooxygenase SsuD/methylene tetrahydromethanopterin reductase-like flavin-dependent oxidoreductase (luciferase family)